ncbi:MAG: cytochrome c oxidase assembly protein [Stellaceae bacterium]
MISNWPTGRAARRWSPEAVDRAAYAVILVLGGILWWLSAVHPALMPVWAPWDFAPVEYLATTLALLWFFRGLASTPVAERLPRWRQIMFLIGVAIIYAVLQTRYEYWSQHMFFLNRIQHVVMHHIGPFLIALGCAGGPIRRGMPAFLRRATRSWPARGAMRVIQHPVVAPVVFVGSFYFWLIPAVHFDAMINAKLYAVMNWTMVVDGILFWWLVLDPRPKPPARIGYGARVALAFAVMFPQIILGAALTFSQQDLYPYYDLCGRLFSNISALNDQHIGGIVIWIPPAMMSAIAVVLVVNALRIHEETTTETDHDAAALAELARGWTGR